MILCMLEKKGVSHLIRLNELCVIVNFFLNIQTATEAEQTSDTYKIQKIK